MGKVISIVGKPKTGKTVSACTFPKPAIMLDFDRGFDSAKAAKHKDGSLVVPDWDKVTVIEFYKKQQVDLSFKSNAIAKGGVPSGVPDSALGANDVIIKYNETMKLLFEKKIDGYQTLIIDPLTSMFRIWKEAVLSTNNIMELRRGDYLTLEGIIANQFIPNLKALSDVIPYIILIDHEDFDATEKGDIISEFPVGPSKNMGKNLSEFLDELWRMEQVNDEYRWRTKRHGLFIGCGSRSNLPDPINPAEFKSLKGLL
jgi:hypothetical protein